MGLEYWKWSGWVASRSALPLKLRPKLSPMEVSALAAGASGRMKGETRMPPTSTATLKTSTRVLWTMVRSPSAAMKTFGRRKTRTTGPLRQTYSYDAGVRSPIRVSAEVSAAVADGRPVVALESTVFSRLGLPAPAGADARRRVYAAVLAAGAVPALTVVLDGVARVGVDEEELPRVLAAD